MGARAALAPLLYMFSRVSITRFRGQKLVREFCTFNSPSIYYMDVTFALRFIILHAQLALEERPQLVENFHYVLHSNIANFTILVSLVYYSMYFLNIPLDV